LFVRGAVVKVENSRSEITLLSDPIRDARQLIQEDLVRFEQALEQALEPQAEYLTDSEYETYRRGKKLRPVVLLLSARVSGTPDLKDLPEKVIKASVSLEMLHVATLIHDDIVDVAPTRRGLKTVYSERGTEMAVLIGDLQFIQAIRCFAEAIDAQEDMHLVRAVLDVGFRICCGELDEIMTDPTWDLATLEKRYFRTVERKTAMLFGLACESGASLSGAGRHACFFLSRYGRRFGSAFQIMDDIFDLMRPEELSGKAPGVDLAQGRLTLPMIYALSELPEDHVVRRIIRREPYSPEDLREAVAAIALSKGLIKAYSKAREMALEAADFLTEFRPSPYRDALADIARYVVNRGYLHPES
jgi:heptaprenyl diphosphate synthase